MELKQFLRVLASGCPTPGGGSASALAAALSASLVAMVAGLSFKTSASGKREMKKIERRALSMQRRLTSAMTEDARSFDAVMEAFRLPKETERERICRSRKIQTAYRKATVIPGLVSEYSVELLRMSRILISKGNPNARSDAGVAFFLANAALEGAILNIRINLRAIREKPFRKKMEALTRRLAKERGKLMPGTLKMLDAI
jgi:formiminotetrahydrofolate cyclodeaminase